VPNDPELRRRITSQHHDTRVAGHPGRWKTLELISRKLLVATDVPLHWPICENMRPLSRTKIQRRRPTGELHPSQPGEPLGCHQCGFHCGTSRLAWVRRSHECGGLSGETSTLHSHNTTIMALGAARLFLHNVLEVARTPTPRCLRRGPQFVAEFTRDCTGCSYHTVNDHGLSPTGGRTDGMCQPRAGAVSPSLCERAAR